MIVAAATIKFHAEHDTESCLLSITAVFIYIYNIFLNTLIYNISLKLYLIFFYLICFFQLIINQLSLILPDRADIFCVSISSVAPLFHDENYIIIKILFIDFKMRQS